MTIGTFYNAATTTGMVAAILTNAAGTSTQIRAASGAANLDYPLIDVFEFDGLAAAPVLDYRFALQTGIGTASNAITTGNIGALAAQPAAIFGVAYHDDGNPSFLPLAGSGFTSMPGVGNYGSGPTGRPQHRRVTSTAPVAATWTAPSGTQAYASFVVALREAGAL